MQAAEQCPDPSAGAQNVRSRSKADAFSNEELFAYLQGEEGFDLSLMPGADWHEKLTVVHDVHYGRLVVSEDARHAARGWLALLDKF